MALFFPDPVHLESICQQKTGGTKFASFGLRFSETPMWCQTLPMLVHRMPCRLDLLSILSCFRVSWPIILGYLAFRGVLTILILAVDSCCTEQLCFSGGGRGHLCAGYVGHNPFSTSPAWDLTRIHSRSLKEAHESRIVCQAGQTSTAFANAISVLPTACRHQYCLSMIVFHL